MTQDEMMARIAIQHTMALYNNTGDRGMIEEMLSCFIEDCILELKEGRYAGRQSLKNFFQGIMDQDYMSGGDHQPARHHITTSRIEFTSDSEAQGWTYYQLIRAGAIVQTGMYIDRFKRTGEQWLFSYRRVKVEFDALPPRV